ncbi:MAG: F0F1 ATP synthase subunit A [Syntrophothermus sp.]
MEEKMHEIGKVTEHIAGTTVFHIGSIPVSSTVVHTWYIMAFLIIAAFILTRRLRSGAPRGAQNLLEMYVEFIYGLLEPALGKEGRRFLPLVGTLFIFILALNWSGVFIPNFVPPTTDLSTTAAFAVATIITVHALAIREKGLKHYVAHYFQPFWFLFPLNIIEELVRPFSLAVRLFGNIFGGKMVFSIIFILVPFLAPTPIMLLEVLMGAIQAFVFSLLTVTYLSGLTKGH